ncbi:MAG: RagB/SusD family nutrient uptake outer membrane protein [Bacteroidota bacterium]
MNITYKNIGWQGVLVLLVMLLGITGCQIEDEGFPNDPTLEDITDNATVGELNNLVSGIESGMRNRLGTYGDDVGVIGREWYRFSGSDPRFTSDLLGKGSAVLDNNTFYLTNPWYERYRVVRNANILLTAIDNTNADITDEQKTGYRAFARTITAYQLLLNVNLLYNNGIRVEVSDPDNLGPFLDLAGSLSAIKSLLDEAATELNSAGSEFLFNLSSGFTGFNTPATFRQFNRAIAARVALYQGDLNGTSSALAESFLDQMGSLDNGVYHVFSSAGGDALNPLFFAPGATGEVRIAHPSFIADVESGDGRLGKVSIRMDTVFQDDLSGNYDVFVFTSTEAPIPVIRNEELILIDAEVKAMNGDAGGAVTAIDIVRTAAGLGGYTGATDQAALMDEIVNQRRYSLYGEGHRWIDLRRLNRLAELPIDRPDDNVWLEFPRPANEN